VGVKATTSRRFSFRASAIGPAAGEDGPGRESDPDSRPRDDGRKPEGMRYGAALEAPGMRRRWLQPSAASGRDAKRRGRQSDNVAAVFIPGIGDRTGGRGGRFPGANPTRTTGGGTTGASLKACAAGAGFEAPGMRRRWLQPSAANGRSAKRRERQSDNVAAVFIPGIGDRVGGRGGRFPARIQPDNMPGDDGRKPEGMRYARGLGGARRS